MEDAVHSDIAVIPGNIPSLKNALALRLLVQVLERQSMGGEERVISHADA